MERRQDAEWFHSAVTETYGSLLSTFTSADFSPSHSDSGFDSTPTGIPSTILRPLVESSSPLPTSLAGPSDSLSSFGDVASALLSNKGAMVGIFTSLGVLILSIFGTVYLGWIRRRQRYLKQRKGWSNASMTFSGIMRRFDTNPSNRDPEPRQAFSIQQMIPQPAPSYRIPVPNASEWWNRGREGRSHQIFYHSCLPSVIDGDVEHLGEETRLTLGEVLEDRWQQVVTSLPPVSQLPIKKPKPARSITRARASRSSTRGRRRVGEFQGGNFTLEDALLPSLSPSPAAYELCSSRSGRHPYAQA